MNKFFINTIFLILLLMLNSSSGNAQVKKVFGLEGKWRFTIGDDMKWAEPGFDDSRWDIIEAPSMWEDQGFYGYNGYGWYRKHFKLDPAMKNYSVYIELGFIDDVDQVFINGQLVGLSGSFPPDYQTAYNAYRKYPVPQSFLNFNGDNLIAVRVYDSQLGGGIVKGELGVFIRKTDMPLTVNLEGTWKFNTGDNLSWKEPGYNDEKWDDILVPAYWETQGYEGYNGFAWYRKTITVPRELGGKKLILVLGKIDDIDETYINGQPIGSTGQMYDNPDKINFQDEWQEIRGYYVPLDLVRAGERITIAIRVYDGYINGGIHEGPIGITTQEDYVEYWRNKRKDKSVWERLFGD